MYVYMFVFFVIDHKGGGRRPVPLGDEACLCDNEV